MISKLKWLLLAIIFINFFATVYGNRTLLLTKYDAQYWQARYQESNWEKGWQASSVMGDGELYAYAGWKQITGGDPTLVNPDNPPLGKYLIGLSIIILRNPLAISVLYGLLLLYFTYLISKQFIKTKGLILLPVALISFDGLFKENLVTSMLDLPFSLFIAMSFYFLIKSLNNRKYFFVLAVSLAAVSLTKMYMVGFALTGIIFLYLVFLFIFIKRKEVFWFIASLPLFILVYLGVYSVFFLNNHNLYDFKYYHFWVRYFARVQVNNYPQFEILRILIIGQWKTWWEGSGIVKVETWSVLWPISTIASLITGISAVLKMKPDFLILPLWIFSMIGMYTYGVPYPRYLLPVLPALYISLIILVEKIYVYEYGKK